MNMTDLKNLVPSIGFIGAGKMANAMIRGIIDKDLVSPANIWANDIEGSKLDALETETGIRVTMNPARLLESVTTIVLSVKPQVIPGVLQSISPSVNPDHLLISIAAGFPLKRIEKHLSPGSRVIRVMPNTPALVNMAAAAFAAGSSVLKGDLERTRALLSSIGVAFEVEEDKLHAVTALSGSGPAYVFKLMEILSASGEAMGLDSKLSRDLTLQTIQGAAALAHASGDGFSRLQEDVTSPGGTTEAALKEFERLGLQNVLTAGIRRACKRSEELAEESG